MFTFRNFSTVNPASLAQQTSPFRRVLATLPVLAVLTAAFFTLPPVQAQVPQQLSQQTGFIDPPGRVARMNLAEGPVSYAPADTGGDPRWMPAALNRPLTTGDRLWTGQRARSELHIGSTAVRLGEQTSLDFLALDDDTTQLRLAQGMVKLRVRNLFDGQRIEINTPNLAFVITQPGDYRIDATPASNFSAGTTRVVVQQGAGTIYGDGGAQVFITSGQQANFTDTQLTPAGPAPEVQDGFDAWAHQRDRQEDQSVSARYVPREVVGYQQLDSYGDWNQDPTYGAVWMPRAVPVNWAPYRAGHWSWIAPWGWTWVDDAPWGFAPFHYGRWAQIGPRWGWVPGQLAARPVYAPALVAFIGGNASGVNWNVSIGEQAAQPGLGWFPLAPGEAFRPAYQHSPRYVSNVNHNIVVNNINATYNYRYQRHQDAVSAINSYDFARGQRVRPEAQRLNPADLGRAQVLVPERGGLPPRLPGLLGLRDLPRGASPSALPPAAVTVRPVVASQLQPPGRRNERREERRDDRRDERPNEPRQNAPQGNARMGRPIESLIGQQPRPGQPVQVIPPALPQPGAAPDRSAFEAEQRTRDQQQRLGRDQQRQQIDAARQQEQQRRQAEDSIGQRALQEQAVRQQQAQRQLQEQAQQRAQQDPQRQAREQQQQQLQQQQQQQQQVQRQQDQARQATQQQAAQQQAQRQQAQEQQIQQAQQAQQRAQQDQARQQQAAQQQQQQQLQQRAQQRPAREQQQPPPEQRQQPDQPREAGRERQPQRRADAPNGAPLRLDERLNRPRD